VPDQWRWVCNSDSSRSVRELVLAMPRSFHDFRSGIDRKPL
jgi:hypothetical protein